MLTGCFVLAQSGNAAGWEETGNPLIRNFRPNDYHASPANHNITQDDRGILYVANDKGILEYDGVHWRLIRIPQNAAVRSLCFANGTIYVGAQGDMGYLAPDSVGNLYFVSLQEFIPEEYRDFKGIWETLAIGDTIYFRSYYGIFRWATGKMTIWKPGFLFHTAFVVNNRFFVREVKSGLKELRRDSLVMVPGSEPFAYKSIAAMLPLDDGNILILSRFSGWFIFDGNSIRHMPTPADNFMANALVFHAIRLPGDKIALATQRAGMTLMDMQGNLLKIVDKGSGLRDKSVNYLYADQDGGLWLALSNGLSRVELPSPFSYFTESEGIQGVISDVIRYRGKIFAATNFGVFYLDSVEMPRSHFRRLPGIQNSTYCFLPRQDKLLIGTHLGLFTHKGNRVDTTEFYMTGSRQVASVTSLQPSMHDDRLLFIGTYRGLHFLQWKSDNKFTTRKLPDFDGYVLNIFEDSRGGLWIGSRDGISYLPPGYRGWLAEEDSTDALRLIRYGKTHGLPEKAVVPVSVGDRLLFATSAGLRKFDPGKQQFLPDTLLGAQFTRTDCAISIIKEDPQGNVWMFGKFGDKPFRGRAVRQPDNSYRWESERFNRLEMLGDITAVYPEKNGVAWFGGYEGLIRYSPKTAFRGTGRGFTTLIRKIIASRDSLIYGGAAPPEGISLEEIELAHGSRYLRFEFAATTFNASSKTRFQVRLDPVDKRWSDWSAETAKEYSRLPTGEYLFRVRARDVYHRISSEDTFAFTILPAWYQTWWAFLLYALTAAGFIVILIKMRVRRLQEKNRQLETLVEERTKTIRKQAEELKELDRIKSRFFANISHEFRTPLTLILGPVDDLKRSARDNFTQDNLTMIERNARRLLQLINQLLNLSRLESGRTPLKVQQGGFPGFLRGVVMSFASHANRRGISLEFKSNLNNDELNDFYFDPDIIEKIIVNLLANALKFTEEGGTVDIEVDIPLNASRLSGREAGTPLSTVREGTERMLEIRVKDTGIGIPEEQLSRIFDRFYQADSSQRRRYEGTGIGLALTKELVELHHGTIEVRSQTGEGSEFIVRLPIGSALFHGDEIAGARSLSLKTGTPAMQESISLPDLEVEVETTPAINTPETPNQPIVLIVDDHPAVRNYIRQHLTGQFTVREARDGKEGIEQAVEFIPDLIVSDVMMPELDGYQLCKKLKTDSRTSHIPIILLTARAGEEDKLAGLETGADDYLSKPFNSKELQLRVHNLIESRRKLRERFRREGLLIPRDAIAPSTEENFLQQLMQVVEAHLDDELFGVESLSRELNMSRRQVHRKIGALTGQTPRDFIRTIRLRRARKMLEQGSGTVSEIAYAVGFSNLSYFAKSFQEEYGILPSKVLEKKRNTF